MIEGQFSPMCVHMCVYIHVYVYTCQPKKTMRHEIPLGINLSSKMGLIPEDNNATRTTA